ncbi:hypothetical protein [Parasitella parasitica]|uniref:Uncharacterized protein n=1 Tax=Parasitella parasitica TaxID=35722 RepID=A0A0B7N9G4_9FUNG|nr:hypothetical protein [Parasitella parasitica]
MLLAILFICQLALAQEESEQYIKRGEIVGLPGLPEYIPSNNEIVEFKSKKDEYYQIKLKDERTGNVLLQSVKMCQMVASNWSDEFVLNLDENNQFYYFSYYASSNYCPQDIEYPIFTKPFTTLINIKTPILGPKPLIGNFASQKKTQSTSKKPTVKVNDEIPDDKEIEEKSFFQKYWYLILGGVLMLMTMGSAPEEPGARR